MATTEMNYIEGGGNNIDFSNYVAKYNTNLVTQSPSAMSISTTGKAKLIVESWTLSQYAYSFTFVNDIESDYRYGFGWYGNQWYYIDTQKASDYISNVTDSGFSITPFYGGSSANPTHYYLMAFG